LYHITLNQHDVLPSWQGYDGGANASNVQALSFSDLLFLFLLHANEIGRAKLQKPIKHTANEGPGTSCGFAGDDEYFDAISQVSGEAHGCTDDQKSLFAQPGQSNDQDTAI
jgi:hypothetical protein